MRPREAFQVLGLEPRYGISARELRAAWMRRAAHAHPDAEGALAESAQVNDALRILSDPILRAEALLELGGAPALDARAVPQEFLLEMMELRERADACAGDAPATAALRDEALSRRDAAIAQIDRAFSERPAGAIDEQCARRITAEIGVIRFFDRMVEQLDRESGAGSATP